MKHAIEYSWYEGLGNHSETNNMSELGSDYEGGETSIKTHKEILTLIGEIKEFERQFGEHNITGPAEEELIERA